MSDLMLPPSISEQEKMLKKLKKGVNYTEVKKVPGAYGEEIHLKVYDSDKQQYTWVPIWTSVAPSKPTKVKEAKKPDNKNTWEDVGKEIHKVAKDTGKIGSDPRIKRRILKRKQDGSDKSALVKESLDNSLSEKESIRLANKKSEEDTSKLGSHFGVPQNPLATLISQMRY